MFSGGAERICIVVAPDKSDIVEYFGSHAASNSICYATQPTPAGLCDAVFRALPFISGDDDILIGLPDTIWFPDDAFARLAAGRFSLLLFPVNHPEQFDSVVTRDNGEVIEIRVKQRGSDPWVWGGMRVPIAVLCDLRDLWEARRRSDEYLGTLINAYLAPGRQVFGIRAGEKYIDVGTFEGYHEAIRAVENLDQNFSFTTSPRLSKEPIEVLGR